MRILVVEDEAKLANLIRRGLQEEGLAADIALQGEDALWMAGSTEYDVIVLDVMLPGIDGFEVCQAPARDEVWTPVLMLTARDAIEDRVAGLDGGADDYLTKPFEFRRAAARIRALARRGAAPRPAVLESAGLRLDPAARERRAAAAGRSSSPATEFAILETFMRRPGHGALALPAPRARLGRSLREPLQRRRRLRPLPAREGRQAVRRPTRSRQCGASATAARRRP